MTPHSVDGIHEAFPSEGGHVDFAPRAQREFDLLEFIKQKLGGRVSVERVAWCSGPLLPMSVHSRRCQWFTRLCSA
jgi:glucokinase